MNFYYDLPIEIQKRILYFVFYEELIEKIKNRFIKNSFIETKIEKNNIVNLKYCNVCELLTIIQNNIPEYVFRASGSSRMDKKDLIYVLINIEYFTKIYNKK
tara:strand:+ start:179 stop:484 length:306 start_codon:yes stop_codon:yes gene_type:complete